jgi:hypothetical protein
MSEYIERSKHAEMTAAVEAHFNSNGSRATPGADAGRTFGKGGTPDWNGTPMDMGQSSGLNYMPKSEAGHSIKTAPFQGNADGLPGSDKKLW